MSHSKLKLTLGRDHSGLRLDQALARAVSEQVGIVLSRRRARELIAAGEVGVDGRPVRIASRPVVAGARIEVALELPSASNPPRVLYEDADLLALDKPAGLPVQATAQRDGETLFNQARRHVATGEGYVALHHRLDRGTSGVVLLAKSRRANPSLAAAFAEHRIEKRYRVLVAVLGETPPASWSVVDRLAKIADGGKLRVERVADGGQEAETSFRTLELLVGAAEIEAWPKTGRMHQIRVHLALSGLPVLGDRLYGVAGIGEIVAPRPMLHAASVALDHPVTGRRLVIASPLPDDYERLRRVLGDGTF